MNFTKNLNAYLSNPKLRNAPLNVGNTPNALLAIGAAQLPIVMNIGDVDKCLKIRKGVKNKNQHELEVEELAMLPQLLENPVMIFKDPKDENRIAIITDRFDKNGNPFLFAVELNSPQDEYVVNKVVSMHGRERSLKSFIAKSNGKEVLGFIPRNISEGNLLAINIKKAPEFLRPAGLQLPEGVKFVGFDNSITQNLNSVKGFDENIFSGGENMITEKSNFMKDCVDGKAGIENLDDYVSFWHENETGNELHEFLGFTEKQYEEWGKNNVRLLRGL